MIDLNRDNCAFLLIDAQGRLLKIMDNYEDIIKSSNVLLKICESMKIPFLMTEQYRKGMGETDSLINLPPEGSYAYLDKKCFTAFINVIKERITELKRKYIIIAGVEAHICVWQTSRDLIREGFVPVLLEDGVGSRNPKNKINALNSIREMGGEILNTETVIFDLMKTAEYPHFKEIQRMII